MVPDLSRPLRLHILGVGGAAMSAIATIAMRMGHTVSGSDQAESAVLDRLRAEGCDVWSPHDPSRLHAADVVAISTAVKADNSELVELQRRGVDIATRPEVMEAFGALKRTVAISGTAGKTTTAAMMAVIGDAAGWRPSMIVGSAIDGLGPGVAWTNSEWFVVEADESDGSFLRFGAEAVIVNNIEPDHLDLWGTMELLEAGFDRFVTQATGVKVVNSDDPGVRALLLRIGDVPGLVTVGFESDSQYRIDGFTASGLSSSFDIVRDGSTLTSVQLSVPGRHNAANAAAALAMAVELGVGSEIAAAGLARFRGAARRFEFRGEARGVTFVDDYAHLPMKARAAVNGALLGGWKRVVAVYQPHRYTRTRDLWRDYAESFTGVDLLVVTGIYAAGQAPIDGVDGRLILDAVTAAHPDQRVVYCETRAALVELLERELAPGDLCLTMNAGDLTTLPDEMLRGRWATGDA
jgi:UDP-N-acetylmuramate--alanine ligase